MNKNGRRLASACSSSERHACGSLFVWRLFHGGAIQFRTEHSYERQVSVAFRVIQAITYHEQVWNGKAGKIRLHGFRAPLGFFQEDAGLYSPWFQWFELTENSLQGFACVKNVIHKEHVASAHVQAQFFCENQLPGRRASAIARNT